MENREALESKEPSGFYHLEGGELLDGGRYKDRTCGPHDVNVMLYR